jgi:hypothetical protein
MKVGLTICGIVMQIISGALLISYADKIFSIKNIEFGDIPRDLRKLYHFCEEGVKVTTAVTGWLLCMIYLLKGLSLWLRRCPHVVTNGPLVPLSARH